MATGNRNTSKAAGKGEAKPAPAPAIVSSKATRSRKAATSVSTSPTSPVELTPQAIVETTEATESPETLGATSRKKRSRAADSSSTTARTAKPARAAASPKSTAAKPPKKDRVAGGKKHSKPDSPVVAEAAKAAPVSSARRKSPATAVRPKSPIGGGVMGSGEDIATITPSVSDSGYEPLAAPRGLRRQIVSSERLEAGLESRMESQPDAGESVVQQVEQPLAETLIDQHPESFASAAGQQSAASGRDDVPVLTRLSPVAGDPTLTDQDIYLFNEGSHLNLWEKLGSHVTKRNGVTGTNFSVWAPNAASVSVMGDFNGWSGDSHPLQKRGGSGIWEGFVPQVGKGAHYKYHIVSEHNGYRVDKADPFSIFQEVAPQTASIVWDLDYEWADAEWMHTRREHNDLHAPMSIYEVHLGSWMRIGEGDGRSATYAEIAQPLADYVKKMNFTHIELMPLMEHPFYGSWGYQCTGFFAPTSRYGTPQDLKHMIDVLHQNGIAVILDWVPSHFPTDEHGLAYFDGTHLYEHADPRKGFHPDWKSFIFNYGRNEVRSFLLSSALYWLGEYHADGLRVDAVASMLYLDYSRKAGEWIPNEFGGRENVEAISFLRRLNEDVYNAHPDVQVIAEESTAWPMVSRPTYIGGLGFGMKWDMGWMHDTLRYFATDPVHRHYHHNDLTFRMMYAFTENFLLPLSHDEVVHGKGSLIGKMPGDEWRRFANLRLLFAHMYSQPAKKLLFMGGEFGQWREWNHDRSLDWDLLENPMHDSLRRWVEDLNKAYRDIPAMHELDLFPEGFEWIDCCDNDQSVVSLVRKSKSKPDEMVMVVLNFTPVPRHNYAVGAPRKGYWQEILNSDAPIYGGSGQGNMGGVEAMPIPLHGRRWSVNLTLPPLGAVFLLSDGFAEAPAGEDDAVLAGLDDEPV
jgi:1,4-alpha-glucan branching enzyme